MEILQRPSREEPAPIQIIEYLGEEKQFRFNQAALDKILRHPDISNKKVSVISVAGQSQMGKSFLMNFLVRYLSANNDARLSGDWLHGCVLDGFAWGKSRARVTVGIQMWSRPFIMNSDTGEEFAVLLLDTPGIMHDDQDEAESAAILALSTLISSVQILNVSCKLRESDLMNLNKCINYGYFVLDRLFNTSDGNGSSHRYAKTRTKMCKPFQSLMFLVRDWCHQNIQPYGFYGGQQLLCKIMEINENHYYDVKQRRHNIISSFNQLSCFLMPHPGLTASKGIDFLGETSGIEKDFLRSLHAFVTCVMDADKMMKKFIDGEMASASELADYITECTRIIHNAVLLEATPETARAVFANLALNYILDESNAISAKKAGPRSKYSDEHSDENSLSFCPSETEVAQKRLRRDTSDLSDIKLNLCEVGYIAEQLNELDCVLKAERGKFIKFEGKEEAELVTFANRITDIIFECKDFVMKSSDILYGIAVVLLNASLISYNELSQSELYLSDFANAILDLTYERMVELLRAFPNKKKARFAMNVQRFLNIKFVSEFSTKYFRIKDQSVILHIIKNAIQWP